MRPRYAGVLAAIIAAGAAVRLALAFATYGQQYDMDSLRIVADALALHPGHVYDTLRWPYPPGFFPFLSAARALAHHTSLPFHGLIQLPAIGADLAIAWLVAWRVRVRAGDTRALAAAALVALGPSFIMISGYHGQIDSVGILPGLAAVLYWERARSNRATVAGLLVGAGAAIKTVPLFLVFALVPTARRRLELVLTPLLAVAVPALLLVPFFIADPSGTHHGLTFNKGVPGLGGLSIVVQPNLADPILRGRHVHATDAVLKLADAQNAMVAIAVVLVGVFLFARRARPLEAASLIWLTVWAVNPNFAFQYVVWGLPFLIAEGAFAIVVLLQALLVFPAIQVYWTSLDAPLPWLYSPLMIAEWAAVVVYLIVRLRAVPARSA